MALENVRIPFTDPGSTNYFHIYPIYTRGITDEKWNINPTSHVEKPELVGDYIPPCNSCPSDETVQASGYI